MASSSSMARWAALAAVLCVAAVALQGRPADAVGELKNSWTYMSGTCKQSYYDIITQYYYRNTVCKYLMFTAFNTTDPAKCPRTEPGSDVWACLHGTPGGALTSTNVTGVWNVWWDFIGKCDLLWVAFRAPLTEDEGTVGGSVTGEASNGEALSSEEYAVLSHDAYENGGMEVIQPVVPIVGVGEGEAGRRRRALLATAAATAPPMPIVDNTCFPRFDNMEQVGEYLKADPAAWNGAAEGAAGSRRVLLWTLAAFAALLAALML